MASLIDLFNPSFFMFLGVIVLVVSVLVVYFESRMREQHHKIASMFSLVSTLAENVNGVKYGMHQLALRGEHAVPIPDDIPISDPIQVPVQTVGKPELIEVSDDDLSDNDDETDIEEVVDLEDDEMEDADRNVKIITINTFNEPSDEEDADSYEEANGLDLDFDPVEELNEFMNQEDDGDVPEIADDYVEQVLDLKYDTVAESNDLNPSESLVPSDNELKSISIHLGDETVHESIDYKKLQLSKLKSIAIEKGLASASDASKLKKPDILKLLGAE